METWISIVLALLEIAFSVVKSRAVKKNQLKFGLICFLIEASIGVGLTVNATLGLRGRQVVIASYPKLATIAAVLFETSIVLIEAMLFLKLMTLRFGDDSERTTSGDTGEEDLDQDSKAGNAAQQVSPSRRRIIKIGLPIGLIYVLICVGSIIYIIVDRIGRSRAGDRGVEVVTLLAFYFALFYVICSSLTFLFRQSHKLYLKHSITNFFLFGPGFGAAVLLVAVETTARRAIYVDSGVVSLSLVLIPGPLSCAIFALWLFPKEPVSTGDELPAVETGSGLETRRNAILT